MKILKRLEKHECQSFNDSTRHLYERIERINQYESDLGKGKPIACYIVDKNHVNGHELHVLFSNRLIKIYNYNSRKHITTLYGRDNQIKRYFKGKAPMHLFDKFKKGYNLI